DLPPVDLGAGVVGEALVAAPRRVASGDGEREAVVGTAVEGLDDPLGELAGDVVDHDELAEHAQPPPPSSVALVSRAVISSSNDLAKEATPCSSSTRATSSRSTPTSPSASRVAWAAAGSASIVRATVPWSRNA